MARIVFMGSPEIAVPSLKTLREAGHEIVAVITQPDKPKGRGRQLAAPPVKNAAESMGLKILQPETIRTTAFSEQLAELHPDFLCVVAYGKILPPQVLRIPKIAPINLHFSLLPKYRGASCVAFALINGEDETGVTTILMDEGMDTGAILLQWSEPIRLEDTVATLSSRLAVLGAQQLVKTVAEMSKGTIQPVPQSDLGSLALPLKKEMGRVDWNLPAKQIYNLYRGLTPWPGIFTFFNGKRLLLIEVKMKHRERPFSGRPGSLHIVSKGELWVNCGEGSALEILQLKPEGKSVLRSSEFVQGLRNKENLSFDIEQ